MAETRAPTLAFDGIDGKYNNRFLVICGCTRALGPDMVTVYRIANLATRSLGFTNSFLDGFLRAESSLIAA